MEAAQLLRTWLTDMRQSFTKWALFRHPTEVFKDFATRASIEAKPQYGTKWRLLNISGPCWLINTKTSPWRHFLDKLYRFLRIEAIWPPWRPILKMAIWGQNGTKTQKAYRKVHHLWRNNLKKFIGLWDIDKTMLKWRPLNYSGPCWQTGINVLPTGHFWSTESWVIERPPF